MKKLNFILLMLLGMASLSYAQGPNYFMFQGVGSQLGTYQQQVIDLPMGTEPYIGQLWLLANDPEIKTNYPLLTTPGANNVIIGHSQGGIRALAWAGYCAQDSTKGPLPSAVITISGLNLGDSTLAQGTGTILNNLNNIYTIVTNGLERATNIGLTQYLNSVDQNWLSQIITGYDYLTGLVSGNTQTINDMTPGSVFIRSFIGGSNITFTWYLLDGWIPIIIAVNVTPAPQIPPSVKIGQIVGADPDPIDMASERMPALSIPTDPQSLKNIVNLGCLATAISTAAWDATEGADEAAEAAAWFIAWIDPGPYDQARAAAEADAENAATESNLNYLLGNYQSYWNSIIGSSASDGLLAQTDTGVSLSLIGGQAIYPASNGIFILPPTNTAYWLPSGLGGIYNPPINHLSEAFDNTVWGSQTSGVYNPHNNLLGSGTTSSIYQGGILQQMLNLTQTIPGGNQNLRATGAIVQ
jgi:hypothetical protein